MKKWVIWYAFTVVLFSLIYWGTWKVMPDSFIIHSELNLSPIKDVYHVLWADEKQSYNEKTTLSTLNNMQDLLSKKFIWHKELLEKRNKLEEKLAELRKEREAAYKQSTSTLWQNVKLKEAEKIKEIREPEVKIVEELTQLLSLPQSTEIAISIAKKRVELAEQKYISSKKIYEHLEYVNKNLILFSDKDALGKVEKIEQEVSNVNTEMDIIEKGIRNIRGEMQEYLSNWHNTRSNQISWIDMLYYSIGISTTTTFGDIVANNKIVRGLVSLQLIISLLIVGGFVNAATAPKGR